MSATRTTLPTSSDEVFVLTTHVVPLGADAIYSVTCEGGESLNVRHVPQDGCDWQGSPGQMAGIDQQRTVSILGESKRNLDVVGAAVEGRDHLTIVVIPNVDGLHIAGASQLREYPVGGDRHVPDARAHLIEVSGCLTVTAHVEHRTSPTLDPRLHPVWPADA